MLSDLFTKMTNAALSKGAANASVVEVSSIKLDKVFRDMCASNICGTYGKCWMCPPDVGEIEVLMDEFRSYKYALVYQTIDMLEDSFDFEGMIDARKNMSKLAQDMREVSSFSELSRTLHLSVGGCGVCSVCSKKTGEPCRFPDLAIPSLEAYGVNVSALASLAGMKYINSKDTVTYFGAVLFDINGSTANNE